MLVHAGYRIFPHVNGLRINQSADGILTVYGGLARTLRPQFTKPLEISDNSDGTFCLSCDQAEHLEKQLNEISADIAHRTAIVERNGYAAAFDYWAKNFPNDVSPAVAAIHRHADIAVITPSVFAHAVVLGLPMPYHEYAKEIGGIWEPGMQSWTFRLTDGEAVTWSFQTLIGGVSGASPEDVVGWMAKASHTGKGT